MARVVPSCKGPGAVYCMLLAFSGMAALLAVLWGLPPALDSAFLAVGALTLVASRKPLAAMLTILAEALALLASASVDPPLASLAGAAAALLAALAFREAGLGVAALASAAIPGAGLAPALAPLAVAGASMAYKLRRLHPALAVLVAATPWLAGGDAAAMAVASLAAFLSLVAGGPSGLEGCPFRSSNPLGISGLAAAAAGVALGLAGLEHWAWLVWSTGFIVQVSGLLVPEPPYALAARASAAPRP